MKYHHVKSSCRNKYRLVMIVNKQFLLQKVPYPVYKQNNNDSRVHFMTWETYMIQYKLKMLSYSNVKPFYLIKSVFPTF